MKTIINYVLVFGFLAFLSNVTIAQETNPEILLKGVAHENKVKLRWIPSNDDDILLGIENGYKITRYTSATNGIKTPNSELINTQIIISPHLTAYNQSQWQSLNTDLAQTVDSILYNSNLDFVPSAQENLADAVELEKNKQGKTFLLTFLAEQDLSIAQGLALYFEDASVVTGNEYLYKVEMLDSTVEPGVTRVLVYESENLTRPVITSAIGGDHIASITWDTEALPEYSLYDIERSVDNVIYRKVNAAPFLQMSGKEGDTEAIYTDSIPRNKKPYYYRVIGRSAFGYKSPPSEPIMIKGRPPREDIQLSIDSFYYNNDDIVFAWTFPQSLRSKFSHFNFYKLDKIGDVPTKLNNLNIGKWLTKFKVRNPSPEAYYFLEGIDKNDYIYRSNAILAQTIDSIPPAAPVGLTGTISRDGTVSLTWDDNTEDDLQGYEVLYSNEENGEFVQMTSSLLANSKYSGLVDNTVEIEYIYYQVIAADHRFNLSEPSEILKLKRPDIIPPSAPILARVLARKNQIRIAWRLSGSTDIENYELQRKPSAGTDWKTIIDFTPEEAPEDLNMIDGENFPSQYIDRVRLKAKPYNYRLLAIDFSGNIASSEIKTIRPYDDGLKGSIRQRELTIVDGNAGLNTDIGSGPNSNTNNNKPNESILLTWEYRTHFSSTIKEFKIFRKSVSLGGSINDNVDITGNYTVISTIEPDMATVLGDFYNGGGSAFVDYFEEKESKGTVRYYYKIIAYHTDGGYSSFSDEQYIDF